MELVKAQAIELKQRLENLKDEQCLVERQLRDLQRQVEPKMKYGNVKVTVQDNYKDHRLDDGKEVIRITDFLLNEEEKKEHLKIFGSISGDWREQRGSVAYYRNEYGILNHVGGGWILLKDGIPCDDEEWESLKQGNIPDKFKSGNLK